SATARQNPVNKSSSAINQNGPNGPNGLNGLIYPNGLALDDGGDLHISDIGAHCVLKLDLLGMVFDEDERINQFLQRRRGEGSA
ncbi:MAG TPA: hypothetical protein VG324_28575, partial [Blastocatellia bacterium]|nr:hypothetical protein [Blastocatellia bacterium]